MNVEQFIKFWPRLSDYGFGYQMDIGGCTNDDRVVRVDPLVISIKDSDASMESRGPAIPFISKETLQDLMDKLWSLGFRPNDIGTAGHLKATQVHLEDAKAIRDKLMDQNAKLIELWTATNPPPQKS